MSSCGRPCSALAFVCLAEPALYGRTFGPGRRPAEGGRAEAAPLYITSDHGMVDIAPQDRIDFDHEWDLQAGVALLGGEARARHVYTEPGASTDVLATWRETLGDRMWIVSREEAIKAGWFGPVVEDRVLHRIGDVIAVAHADTAVIATRTEPGASTMTGLHGALTPTELLVPLLRGQT